MPYDLGYPLRLLETLSVWWSREWKVDNFVDLHPLHL